MALWTPYADDVPLDLSKTAAVQEAQFTYSREFPAPQLTVPPNFVPYDGYYAPVGHAAPQLTVPPDFVHYDGYYAPVEQVSPEGSSYAYDSVPFSPMTQRHVPLSPPVSPIEATAKRPYHMIDADSLSDDPVYQEFERNALRVMAEKNGGTLLGNNPRMRRTVQSTNSDAANDSYRRQRERNNYAAKQSRDRRKLREIHLALKVSYLKKEVAALKAALSASVCGSCQQSCLY